MNLARVCLVTGREAPASSSVSIRARPHPCAGRSRRNRCVDHQFARSPGNHPALSGEESYGQRALDVLHAFHDQMKAAPSGFAHMVAAVDYYLRSPREIALVGDRESPEISGALRSLWGQFRPHDLIVSFDPASDDATRAEAEIPLLAGKKVVDQRPTFYLCENYACQAPTHDLDEVIAERHP